MSMSGQCMYICMRILCMNCTVVWAIVGQLEEEYSCGHGSLTHPLVPPMTTAPPTELSDTNISVCCVGVQLNLANPYTYHNAITNTLLHNIVQCTIACTYVAYT